MVIEGGPLLDELTLVTKAGLSDTLSKKAWSCTLRCMLEALKRCRSTDVSEIPGDLAATLLATIAM